MKLLFDEGLSPRLVPLLRDVFPESKSALRNGLARVGDRKILEYAATHGFILVSTDTDFECLLHQFPGAKVVILRSCDYPTEIAADVLRRNAIRIPAVTAILREGLVLREKEACPFIPATCPGYAKPCCLPQL